MRLENFPECPDNPCVGGPGRPCRNVVAMALLLGAVADLLNGSVQATMAGVTEWFAEPLPMSLHEMLYQLHSRGLIEQWDGSNFPPGGVLILTPRGWDTLNGVVKEWPDLIGWADLLPMTFGTDRLTIEEISR